MIRYFKMFMCLFWLCTASIIQAQKTMGVAALSSATKRVAFLIGNNNYTNVHPLKNPERDVDALQKVLEGLGFKVFAYKNCSLSETQQVYSDFLKQLDHVKPEVAWVYFSGHGLGVNGVNYLLPTDTSIGCVEQLQSYEAVSLNSWIEDLLKKQIKHNFIFLDACRDLGKLTHCSGAAITGAVQGLSKPTEKYRGLLIAFATTEGNTADDSNFDKNNSLFTAELIKYLPTPNIGIRQVLDLAKQGTYLRSGQTQDPKRWDDLVEDYVFVRTKSEASPSPAAPIQKVISVVAYKPNSSEVDMGLAKMTQQQLKVHEQLKAEYPDHDIRLQTNSKGLAADEIVCTVRRQTETSPNPVAGFNLIKADTRLTLTFKKGQDLLDEIELSEGGTDHQKNIAIQNSIERAMEHLKNQTINLKR
ncbi:caspase family protein [Runella salmonicolor]|uniref:Caspase family protein n=1 Tax=Runella salmonicolor TaxID=2950278 RepID=A0ABT1FWT2_9BACT|nr:caspase family protein [Runella salmonicolor]MCP1386229.1 caspase family protein [Runella salmonicolor]